MGEKGGKPSNGIDRRTLLKTTGATAAVGAGIFGTGAAASSDDGIAIRPGDDTVPHPDLDYYKPHHSLLEITSHWPLLAFEMNDVMSYIEKSDRTRQEKREARDALVDLRRRFPVVEKRDTEDENRIWWTLAPGADSRKKGDDETFAHVAKVHANGMQRNGLSTQWWHNSHRKQTTTAAKEIGLSDSKASTIGDWADDPDKVDHYSVSFDDNWSHDTDLEEAFEYGLNKVHRHYSHYLDTDGAKIFSCYHNSHDKNYNVGTAHKAGAWHMDQADSAYYTSTQDEYLGKATHYPEDVANPLHSGMGWEQLTVDLHYTSDEDDNVGWNVSTKKWLHDEYEEFLSDQWTSGWNFKNEFKSSDCDGCYYYYDIIDREQAIWDMANESGKHSETVYQKIHSEGDVDWTSWSWDTESDLANITDNMMHTCGLYVRGFIREYYS
jgi:hypothetical protein